MNCGRWLLFVVSWLFFAVQELFAEEDTVIRIHRDVPVCGGSLSGPRGQFETPNAAGSQEYPSNAYCKWTITVNRGEVVWLRFLNFGLEGATPGCTRDFVEIYDSGEHGGNSSIGRFCDVDIPRPITSNSNQITVVFATDSSINFGGFTAIYKAQPAPIFPCGGTLGHGKGRIGTPKDPSTNQYRANTTCTWTISGRVGESISLKFIVFQLEDDFSPCLLDYVEITDVGNEGYNASLGRFCGDDMPSVIVSKSNVITVIFVSDHAINSEGFVADYETTMAAYLHCGGNFVGPQGWFGLPRDEVSQEYDANMTCIWTIDSAPGARVALKFLDFNTEKNDACTFDYVLVEDTGVAGSVTELGRFCGFDLPAPVTSKTSQITVTFSSDKSVQRSGFIATYKTPTAVSSRTNAAVSR